MQQIRQYPRYHPANAFALDGSEWIISHPYGGQYRIQAGLATDLERANSDIGKLITVLAMWASTCEAYDLAMDALKDRLRKAVAEITEEYSGDPVWEPEEPVVRGLWQPDPDPEEELLLRAGELW
jgi:hypothetical protein